LFSNGCRLGSAILNLLLFPKPSKTAKIDQELIKISKITQKSKNVKFTVKKVVIFYLKILKKNACQKVVAMVTSNLIHKDLLYQIVPR